MPNLVWDADGQRLFEAGVDHVALFVMGANNTYGTGVAWNGITNVSVNGSGSEENALWADNMKYASLRSAEECEGSIQAYNYPPEFYACDGFEEVNGVVLGQQARKKFALAYRTKIGNDTNGLDHGYKLHIIYGMSANPSERAYETLNDSPDAIQFSWDFTTTPITVPGHNPVAHIEISSLNDNAKYASAMSSIESGTLPLPDSLIGA
jgi:hypothetical protein